MPLYNKKVTNIEPYKNEHYIGDYWAEEGEKRNMRERTV